MEISTLTQLFKCLSDPVRLRILNLLFHQPVICVCDIVATLGLPQSVVSRHLAYLRKHDMVVAERRGNWQYYSHCLFNEGAEDLHPEGDLFKQLQLLLEREPRCESDLERMKTNSECC